MNMYRSNFLEEFRNIWKKPDNGLIQLIVINVIVFVVINLFRVILTIAGNTDAYVWFIENLALPSDFATFIHKPWTLITYFFTHEGFFHILFNMLFLYWFGKIVHDLLGNNKLVNLYVLGGIIGGITYMLVYNLIPFYHDRVNQSILIGASAGVFAVVVGAATYFPNYSLYLLFLGPIKIKYIALFYVLLSFFRIDGTNAGGDLAHLGGAAIGFLYILQLRKGNDLGQPITQFIVWVKSLFAPRPKIRVSYKNKKTQSHSSSSAKRKTEKPEEGKVSQDEIDRILDKISQGGYESLTKEEKQKLFDASRK